MKTSRVLTAGFFAALVAGYGAISTAGPHGRFAMHGAAPSGVTGGGIALRATPTFGRLTNGITGGGIRTSGITAGGRTSGITGGGFVNGITGGGRTRGITGGGITSSITGADINRWHHRRWPEL